MSEQGGAGQAAARPSAPGPVALSLRSIEGRRTHYGASALVAFASLAVGLAQPAVVAVAVNQAIAGEIGAGFWAFAGIAALSLALGMAGSTADVRWRTTALRRLTLDGAAKALRLGLPGHRPYQRGDLLQRTMGDTEMLASFPATLLRVSTGVGLAVGSVVALALIHWHFVVVWLACLAAAAVLTRVVLRHIEARQTTLAESSGKLVGLLLGALDGRRTIRASGTAEREIARVSGQADAVGKAGRDIQISAGHSAALLQLSDHAVVLLATVAGVLLLRADEISPGYFLAALQYSRQAFAAASGVVDNGLFHFAIARACAGRVHELMDKPDAVPRADAGSANLPAEGGLDIEFDAVSVRGDPEGPPLLDAASLQVPANGVVALVGSSGAGKTTLASLAGRLLEPDRGEVRLGGAPLRLFEERHLASLVAYAFEEPVLTGTIRETITLGRDASDEEVRAAAMLAEADGFVSRLPDGYDTDTAVLELSGGERQRLGIARALLAPRGAVSRVLVLDDATSHLDIATEARLATALQAARSGRTCLLVTHRASLTRHADRVAWIDKARVRAVATPAELLPGEEYRLAAFGDDGESGG